MLQWPMKGDDKFLLIYIIGHLYIMDDNSYTLLIVYRTNISPILSSKSEYQ